jgi:hypothetical protein
MDKDKCFLISHSHQCDKILNLCIECNNKNRWEEFYNKYANK